MKRDEMYPNHYIADENKVIVPKVREDDEIGTDSIWLSIFDNINNYEEIDKQEEESKQEPEENPEEN